MKKSAALDVGWPLMYTPARTMAATTRTASTMPTMVPRCTGGPLALGARLFWRPAERP